MDADQIRQLDGDALTELAFEAGLAPEGVAWHPVLLGYGHGPHAWTPADTLATADAVLRHLRTLGYSTSVSWLADDRLYGEAWACTEGRRGVWVRWPSPEAATEAHAILLTAVLAMAGQEEPA